MSGLTIAFDDLHLLIDGVFCGSFSGDADFTEDGNIEEIRLDGWDDFRRDAKLTQAILPVPPEGRVRDFAGMIARILAIDIANQYADDIREAIEIYLEDLREGPEYDANEAA